MARSIVDELLDRLLRAFPPDRDYGRDDFSTPPMPAPVAHFLTQRLQQRLEVEMHDLREARASWIDYDHPAVQKADRAFRTAVAPHLHIPASEWQGMLRRAVQRVTAYLIHPTQTMTAFVFDDQEGELDAPRIRSRIQFFSAYPYLRETIGAYLDRNGTASIGRDRFEALLVRIDERMVADYEVDDWMRLLDPLFELMDVAEQRGVPVSFLQTFFQGKGASAVVQRLHTVSLEHGATLLDRADLRRLLTSSGTSSGDVAPEAATTPPDPPHASSSEAPPPPQADASSRSETPEGPAPLWKQFQRPAAPREKPPSPPREEPSPPTVEPAGEASNEPLWTRFRPKTEPAASSSSDAQPLSQEDLAALERAVLGTQRDHRALFIRELFGGSRSEYTQTLQRLRTAPNWTRASQIIAQDVFRAHQVNIYSEPAVAFTNAVEDRFRQRS